MIGREGLKGFIGKNGGEEQGFFLFFTLERGGMSCLNACGLHGVSLMVLSD